MELAEQRYQHWCAQKTLDPELRQELAAMQNDADKITDAFYRDLEFGTAGLRGVLGAGTNRMNIYVIRRATQAVADYLNETDLPKTVAIGHDSRIKSDVFAREAAAVFAANGITAYLYPRLEPVPALSFAVRHLHCGLGICVTASHNPAAYNGYKVYGSDGCQMTPEAAKRVVALLEQMDYFTAARTEDFDAALAAGRIRYIPDEVLDAFVDAVYAQRVGSGDGIAKYPFGDSTTFKSHCAGGGGGPASFYDHSQPYPTTTSGGNGGSNGGNGGYAGSGSGAGGDYGGGRGGSYGGSAATFYGGGGGGGGANGDNNSGGSGYAGGAGYQGVVYIRVPA